MNNRIFYFKKLTRWDVNSVIVYLLISILFYVLFYQFNDNQKAQLILIYSFGTHTFIYLFNYRSLRNLTVYSIWVFFGIVHYATYIYLKDDISLSQFRGHASLYLTSTLPLLVLFQVLRFISSKLQGQELVVPANFSEKDIFEERKVTPVDYILLIVYMIAVFSLQL